MSADAGGADGAGEVGGEGLRRPAEMVVVRSGWHWWVVMVVTAVAGPCAAIWVATANQHRSEQALCEVIVLSDEAYRANPNPGPTVQRLAAAMGRLREKYDC